MADAVNPGAGTPAPTVVPDGAPTPTGNAPTGDESANPSKRDWADNAKAIRDVKAQNQQILERLASLSPASPPAAGNAPAKNEPSAPAADAALAEVRELRRTLDVKDAMLSAGVTDSKARRLIELAVKAENPSDVGAFVTDYAAVLAKAAPVPATPTTPAAAAPPASPGRTDTGAPGVRPDAPLPDNPNKVPIETWKALSPEKRRAHLDSWLAKGNSTNWMKGQGPKPK